MKVLVIGGAGYIGSHTARVLRSHGHEVIIYDNLSTGHDFLAKGFELVVGDIGDEAKVRHELSRVEAVIHFAAHAYVGESTANPRKYFRNNVESALTLLNAALDAGVGKFVFSSTCAIYGSPAKVPITEDAPRQPINPYGVSKLFLEHALEAYDAAYGLRFAALRYFNAAGADESGEIGEVHTPETHLIPLALGATLRALALCRFLELTIPPPMAPASGITFMSTTWPKRTRWPWSVCCVASRLSRPISAPGPAIPSSRY